MVEITLNDTELVLNLTGMNKLWALKSQVTIPYANIKKVTTVADLKTSDYFKWFTVRAGLSLPGVAGEGTFWTHAGKVFIDIRQGGAGIVLQLENDEYTEVVVEVAEPKKIAEQINQKIQ